MSAVKNVIFIMLDTLQYNYLGCYGNDWIKTPNLDRFARENTLFENAYSEGLPTIPVRRAMMTGRYTLPYGGWRPLTQEDTSLTDMLWCSSVQTALVYDAPPMRLPKYGYSRGFDYVKFCNGHELDQETFSEVPLDPALNPLDYLPECCGKLDANGNPPPFAEPLIRQVGCFLRLRQYWRDDSDSYISVVSNEADAWLREKRDKSRPFFMWLDSFDPHEPWDAPSVWNGTPCPYDPDWKGKPLVMAPWTPVEGLLSDEECAHIRALYAEKVTNVDKWVGKLLDSIREQGLWDDTMIVITSDHGQPMGKGEHGHGIMRKCRPWPYEELVHVPLLVRYPGAKGGQRVKSLVQNVDVPATIMDALGKLDTHAHSGDGTHEGVKVYGAEDMHGKSLLPIIRGETDRVRDYALAGFYGMSWSLITEEYSFIHWLKTDVDTNEMRSVFYDGAGKGGNAGKNSSKIEMKEDMWTCVPGAEVTVPEKDELYDRKADPKQLNNIISQQPEKAKELLQQLKLAIGELRTM